MRLGRCRKPPRGSYSRLCAQVTVLGRGPARLGLSQGSARGYREKQTPWPVQSTPFPLLFLLLLRDPPLLFSHGGGGAFPPLSAYLLSACWASCCMLRDPGQKDTAMPARGAGFYLL